LPAKRAFATATDIRTPAIATLPIVIFPRLKMMNHSRKLASIQKNVDSSTTPSYVPNSAAL
jgi:hypothetical protein